MWPPLLSHLERGKQNRAALSALFWYLRAVQEQALILLRELILRVHHPTLAPLIRKGNEAQVIGGHDITSRGGRENYIVSHARTG